MNIGQKIVILFKHVLKSKKPRLKARAKLYYLDLASLPLKNWVEIQKNNLTKTRRGRRGSEIEDQLAYEDLNDEYINRYGLDKYYLKLLKLLKVKAMAELDYILTGDRRKLTEIEIKEADLKVMLTTKGTGLTIEASLIHISKFLGVWVNVNTITTLEYYDLLGELERYTKATSEKINQTKRNGKNK
jgi:hypothetical protein